MLTLMILSIAFLANTVFGVPEGVPTCAISCYDKDVDECARSDVYCRCINKELVKTVANCLRDVCSIEELEIIGPIAKEWCASHGASLIVPPFTPTPTNSGSATPTVTTTPSATPSATSETSPAQSNEEAARNGNGVSPLNVNVVVGVVAFGLVALAI